MSDPHAAHDSRKFDLVLFGATGFVGRITAQYLARHAPTGLSWALAGRSRSKLEALGQDLRTQSRPPDGVLVADTDDLGSLKEMASRSTTLISTVGPYAKLGGGVVAACVDQCTDYLDLTGEPQFIRASIDAHHEAARARGVRVVHCCGFDSVPSDLGTWLLQEALIARDGAPAQQVRFFLDGGKGGFSGGTVASLANVMAEADRPEVQRVLRDPYSLNPAGQRSGPDSAEQLGAERDPVSGKWTAPFLMGVVNERVVRRSNALLSFRYGREFSYRELTPTGPGALGAAGAYALAGGLTGLQLALAQPTLRRALCDWVLPKPGQGPSQASMSRGYFRVTLSGRSGGKELGRVRVVGHRDPGYGATSCMLAESALCMLETRGKHGDGVHFGVLTPAVAFGKALSRRLFGRDVEFFVEA